MQAVPVRGLDPGQSLNQERVESLVPVRVGLTARTHHAHPPAAAVEIERKSPEVTARNATVKAEAAAEGAAAVVAAVTHHDRGLVAAGHLRALQRRMTSRYRKKKTASRRSVTIGRIRIRRTRNRIAVVGFRLGKGTAVGGIVDLVLEADVMGQEAGKTARDLDIVQDLATGLDREIGPVRQDAGLAHLEAAEDETTAVNIAAVEPAAEIVTPEETTAAAIVAVRLSAAVVAVAAGVAAVAASPSRDAEKVLPLVTTTDAPQESARATNGDARTNNQLLRGHQWVRQLLDLMTDEVVDLILTVATIMVIGTLAVSSLTSDENQSKTVVIGMMIERDR